MIARCFFPLIAFLWLALPVNAEIKIQEVTSPGGIKAWLVEEHAIPFIALEVGFSGGASLDPADKAGVTNLMVGLLEEGTGDMDAAGFLRASEELAADFGFRATRDDVVITAQVLSENSSEALALLKQAITAPAFNQVAVDRVKEQVLSSIRSSATNPDDIADRTMNALAFADHPYGRPKQGTAASVAALGVADLRNAHLGAMARDRMVVGVVGDITADELGVLLDDLLGDLPRSGAPLPSKTEFTAGGGVTIVEFDTPQSVAVFAQPGLERHHPEFFPALVMNHILGGSGFASRLTQEVREKRGLTYGVYSYLAPMDLAHFMGGGVASANERIKEALDVIQAEWQRMARGGVTEQELEEAQKYLTGAYPLRFDGNGRIASILAGMQAQDLPLSYIAERNEMVDAVTQEDIASVANWLLKPENLRIIVVGKPVGMEERGRQP